MNNKIKIFTTVLFTTTAFASQNLMEFGNAQSLPSISLLQPRIFYKQKPDTWQIREGFIYTKHITQGLKKTELFTNDPKEMIQKIFIRKGDHAITITFNKDNLEDSLINPVLKKLNIPVDSNISDITLTDPTACNIGLAYFYHLNAIPDFIIDHILKLKIFKVEDFRISAAKIIEIVEHKFNLNNSQNHQIEILEADLKDCIFNQLKLIPNPFHYQSACSDIIKYLTNEMPDCSNLICELCECITDKNLPFYAEAKLIIAEAALGREHSSEKTIEERYCKSIVTLLESTQATRNFSNHIILLNTIVNAFINNDRLSVDVPNLSNLTVSAESIFDLLNIIRQQQEVIKRLSSKIE